MSTLDSFTPEQHRERYEQLRRAAQARAGRPALPTPGGFTVSGDALLTETIPAGWYWTARVGRGSVLRFTVPSGNTSASLLAWNADDPSERLNVADTVKLQWTAAIGKGAVLFSDMGRVLCSIVDERSGGHDALTGGSGPWTNAVPGAAVPRNTRDNLRLAASKFGLGRRDVAPCFTFFAGVRTSESGGFVWKSSAQPGDFVDLRCEMNLFVAVSNCRHPLDPAAGVPGELTASIFRAAPFGPDDLCRNAGEEIARGFENTAAFFGPGAR